MTNRAVFLDRDGTLVHPRHYPSTPDELKLYEGIEPSLRLLQGSGFRLVVVTNQSGLARGLFTESDLERMHAHLRDELGRQGVRVDAIYYCPHHVDGVIPELSRECDCRKPAPGMLLQAAQDLDLNLQASWFIGDILDDVEAGRRAGCKTILVDLGTESSPDTPLRQPDFVARDTLHALQIVTTVEGIDRPVDLDYRPHSWPEEPALLLCSGGVDARG